jgi:hypothetical protein
MHIAAGINQPKGPEINLRLPVPAAHWISVDPATKIVLSPNLLNPFTIIK